MNKDQLSTSVNSLLELDNISVNPSYSASEEESERVGMEELDTEMDGEGKKKKKQVKKRRKKKENLENEDSCAEFEVRAQTESGDPSNDSGLAVQKGLKGRDPSPAKSGRGLMVRKLESGGRFRTKLGGGTSPLSGHPAKLSSTFPREGQKGVVDGAVTAKTRRGSASALHSSPAQDSMSRKDSSGMDKFARHGSTDSGQGETAPHHFGRKDAGGKDKQKKGKNGGKDKKQAKKDGQPLSPGGQPSDSSGATPKKQSFKPFDKYWMEEDVSKLVKQGKVVKGTLRINPKNFEEAYLDSPDGGSDIFINGVHARNRALQGDVVAVQILTGEVIMTPKSQRMSTPRKLLANQPIIAVSESPDRQGSSTPGSSTPKKLGGRYFFGSQGDFDTSSLNELDVSDNMSSLYLNNSEAAFGFADVSATSGEEQDKVGDLVRREWSDARSEVSSSSEVIEDAPRTPSNNRGSSTSGGGTPQKIGGTLGNDPRMAPKTARVVYICEYKHSRAASGHLKLPSNPRAPDVMFAPTDHRVPRIYIPRKECPATFSQRPQDYANTLFIAQIIDWPLISAFAKGHLLYSIGQAGEVEAETTAMLIEHGIDSSEFTTEVLEDLPKERPWRIPAEELSQRRDLRSECIFTIDPTTARDLDDALHCKALGDGIYEMGVHIADVSYFVKEDTSLDKTASHRATSVYLVQKVIPMLPRLLCEELCSLNPDQERLTMSFIWRMTEEGEILQEWCGRSVIRSCVKLSYLHAQDMIENWEEKGDDIVLPEITNGFGRNEVAQAVLNMQKIASNLRKKRFDGGALRLDQVKLQYSLNAETTLPNGYSVYQQKDSNRLVEEFMLLANMAAAHRIFKAEPQRAFLRRHPPPKEKMMDDLATLCESLGLDMDGTTAGKLQASLNRYCTSEEQAKCLLKVLTVLYSKPMQKARYFCCASLEDEEMYRHYALNVPLYTHFTSPIRRYPDILVHRMLASSLACGPVMERDPERLQRQAMRCNDAKDSAKEVSDKSSDLFFCQFVKECGPLVEKAIVMAVLDRSFDVLIINLGQVKRVYCNAIPLKKLIAVPIAKYYELTLEWEDEAGSKGVTQVIKMFSQVTVELTADRMPGKYKAVLQRPCNSS
ncbi:DIS3-like exonuclease 2 [Strongylocentrotus purpuratus]|uniref:DIS3-like exonuclease 2 n=1 Tax=Strongylocentrotus purpuratus TaxID=7668 RepID=A0A7M7SX18_STRPU|nr:DIS3-like exonuclease 2 [Strongylocentrotus purpuratus]XP_030837619.1 DIS3-like exonuclease 2 [Strongylocentrotus purpuratus]XP_030837621.1 DIS3-like exonuclease 2 [Strongylocentrotus purpuratus]